MSRKTAREIDAAFAAFDRTVEAQARQGASDVLDKMETDSPVWTGHYQRNHQAQAVSAGESANFELIGERGGPTEFGEGPTPPPHKQFAVNGLAEREQSNLVEFDFGGDLVIGNPVGADAQNPYPVKIEQGLMTGGRNLYHTSARILANVLASTSDIAITKRRV